MTSTPDPIGFFGKLNATVVTTITPEFRQIAAVRRPGASRCVPGPAGFSLEPEYRTIDGVKVRFAQGGKADGPQILMLSPLPHSIVCFDPIWSKLGEHCRLVALDMPGFGGSEGGLEFMSFEAQGRFLARFVQELGLSQVHIVGPDVGMAAALHYAIHHEHDIASLIIGDGPGIAPSANGSIISKLVNSGFWRAMFTLTGAQAFVEGGYRLGCVHYVPTAAEVADYVASYDGRIGTITHWFKTYPQSLATVDPHLDELALPTKIFWGDLDIFLLLDNGQRLHQRLKRSSLTVFEQCGHFSYQDKADEFAEMVLQWVQGGYQSV